MLPHIGHVDTPRASLGRWSRIGRIGLAVAGLAYLIYPFATPSTASAVAWRFVPPIAINLALAVLFAYTLLPGRQPMISRFALAERGRLEPDLERHARRLTWIWVAFFLLMAAIAAVLPLYASERAWALFAGAGNYLCIVALFVGEWLYRRRRFAHYAHLSPLAQWRVVRKTMFRSDRVRSSE